MNQLRVSVATYNQVVFSHPENGVSMLALERKATLQKDGSASVRAQPFGGGVSILKLEPLQEIIGEIQFDSERSQQEQDFRILIHPSQWNAVKQYCLHFLSNTDDSTIESTPDRELVEEFKETLQVELKPNQYKVEPTGFVIEDKPVFTENWYAQGFLTVRVYRTYRVDLLDANLCQTLMDTSQRVTDEVLRRRSLDNGRGRANSVLALPLERIQEIFLALSSEKRFTNIEVDQYMLDKSVLAILGEVDVPQYKRM